MILNLNEGKIMSQFHTIIKQVNNRTLVAEVWADSKTKARGRAYSKIGIFLKSGCVEMYFGDVKISGKLECVKFIN